MKYIYKSVVLALIGTIIGCSSQDDSPEIITDPVIDTTPKVNSYTPTEGLENDTVTIKGEYIYLPSRKTNVFFSDIEAEIISSEEDELKVIAPVGIEKSTSAEITIAIDGEKLDVGSFSIIQDDFKYLVLANNGNLYTIGNKTARTQFYSDYIIDESITSGTSPCLPNTLTQNNNYIYSVINVGAINNKLVVFNKKTKETEVVDLSFPDDVYYQANLGSLLYALDWDDSSKNLVGLFINDNGHGGDESFVVSIDPNTYQVTSQNFSFLNEHYASIQLMDQKIYMTSRNNTGVDIKAVDLVSKTVDTINFNQPASTYKLAAVPKQQLLIGFQGKHLTIINTNSLETETIETDFESNNFGNLPGKGYYDNENNSYVIAMRTRPFIFGEGPGTGNGPIYLVSYNIVDKTYNAIKLRTSEYADVDFFQVIGKVE